MQNKLFIISFIFNLAVFSLVLTGVIFMMFFSNGALQVRDASVFKFFTFQSNLFMGFVAIIYAYYQFLIIKKKKDKMPHVLNVFYHVGVTAVALTFTVVIAFLGPIYGYNLMYRQANLFFHALVPVFAMINYLFFMHTAKIRFIDTLFAILPSMLYGIVYFTIVASQNAYGDVNVDFYMFGKDGPLMGVINFLVVITAAYLIGLILYLVNGLIFKKRK